MNYTPDMYYPYHVRELRSHILFDLGNSIRSFREVNGDTQEELAKALNITKSTICKYENGDIEIPASILPLIARRYNIEISSLYDNLDRNSEHYFFYDMVSNGMRLYKDDTIVPSMVTIITDYLQEFMTTKAENSFDIYYAYIKFLKEIELNTFELTTLYDKQEKMSDIFKTLISDIDKIHINNYHTNSSVFAKELFDALGNNYID